jgi:nuclear GTP-binding protein
MAKEKGTNFYRDEKKLKQVNLLKGGKPTRDRTGKIVKAAAFQNTLPSGTQVRVGANRKWFENTRVISQKDLESFRNAVSEKKDDPYTFLMRQNKLPMSLMNDTSKLYRMNILQVSIT